MLSFRSKIEIGLAFLVLVSIAIVMSSYISAKRDAVKLQETLATQNAVIANADKRETARAVELKQSLAELEDLKKKTTTPAAIVRELPTVLPLPLPITIRVPAAGAPGDPGPPPDAIIPAQDLKPLFDFAANCQECQKKLAAATADKADDAIKIGALTKERDEAVTAFKGGSKWTRIKKAAKWCAIGAAMGAAAVAVLKK
jgi:hypothetical protein